VVVSVLIEGLRVVLVENIHGKTPAMLVKVHFFKDHFSPDINVKLG